MNTPDESALDPLLEAVGTELMRMARRRARVYPGSAIDLSAFRILWLLTESGPLTMKDLSYELMLEQSTVSRQVKAAIERGLIEKYEAPGSAARLLRATVAGNEAYEQEAQLRAGIISAALDLMGVERAADFVKELAVFNDSLDEAHAQAKFVD